MKNWKVPLLKYSPRVLFMCVYITKGCGPILLRQPFLFFGFFAECEFSLFRPVLSLTAGSSFWAFWGSDLVAGASWVQKIEHPEIEAEQPSALGPQVEKLTTSSSWHAFLTLTLTLSEVVVLGTQSVPSLLLGFQVQGAQSSSYTL